MAPRPNRSDDGLFEVYPMEMKEKPMNVKAREALSAHENSVHYMEALEEDLRVIRQNLKVADENLAQLRSKLNEAKETLNWNVKDRERLLLEKVNADIKVKELKKEKSEAKVTEENYLHRGVIISARNRTVRQLLRDIENLKTQNDNLHEEMADTEVQTTNTCNKAIDLIRDKDNEIKRLKRKVSGLECERVTVPDGFIHGDGIGPIGVPYVDTGFKFRGLNVLLEGASNLDVVNFRKRINQFLKPFHDILGDDLIREDIPAYRTMKKDYIKAITKIEHYKVRLANCGFHAEQALKSCGMDFLTPRAYTLLCDIREEATLDDGRKQATNTRTGE